MCASNAAVLKACNVPGPVSYYGKMQVVGNRIYGSHNHAPVQVKGISFYWSIWKGEEFYNAGAVDALVDGWKAEIIRIPMSVETDEKRQGGNYGYLNPEGRERQIALVERLVDAAIARDIYVIIDYHSHNAHLHTQNAKEFFGYMAKKYGGYDNVIFEIYNEPITPDWQTIKKYAVAVIDTIRVYSDNLVIVGTENYSQRVDIASLSPLEDSNVAYVFHFYATHEDQERDYVTKALNNNVALFASEWGNAYVAGEKNGKTDVKAFENSDKWHVLLDSNMISSANWSIYSRDIAPSNAELSLFGPATGTVSRTGKGWSDTTNMTASGLYVYKMLKRHASNALWRK
jgi:endoglucanase